MPGYTNVAGVNDQHEFPPDVRSKLADSTELKTKFSRKNRRRISASSSPIYQANGSGSNFTLSGTNLYQHARLSQRTLKPGRNLHINFLTVGGPGEQGLGGDGSNITFRVSVESPAGTFYPAYTRDGNRDVVVTPGGGIGRLTVPGFKVPGNNTEWWIRYRVVGTAGGAIPYTVRPNLSTEWASGPTATATDFTMTNAGAPTAGSGLPGYSGAPVMLSYEPYDNTTPCVVLIGDSITQGQGEDSSNTAYWTSNPGGWAMRALSSDGNTGRSLPGVSALNLACSAETTTQSWAATGAKSRTALLDEIDPTTAWTAYTNDITQTLAVLQASFLQLWNDLNDRGIRVVAFTIPPRTSSTDNWATTANQTSNNGAVRTPANQWLRAGAPINPTTKVAVAVGTAGALTAGSPGHPLSQVVDTASAVETSTDSGIWKVNGTANAYTVDGTHPSALGHQTLAAVAYAQAVPTIV